MRRLPIMSYVIMAFATIGAVFGFWYGFVDKQPIRVVQGQMFIVYALLLLISEKIRRL